MQFAVHAVLVDSAAESAVAPSARHDGAATSCDEVRKGVAEKAKDPDPKPNGNGKHADDYLTHRHSSYGGWTDASQAFVLCKQGLRKNTSTASATVVKGQTHQV